MRLLQITVSKSWRGHEQKIINLYESFRDMGFVEEQWILCPSDSKIYKIAIDKGMNVIPLDLKYKFDLKFARQLKIIANQNKADLIFIHNSQSHTLAVLSALFFRLKIPLVVCRTQIKRIDANFFKKWKYNYSGIKKIICVSNPVVEILKLNIKDHNKLCVVGSVVDVGKFIKKERKGVLHAEYNIPCDYKIIGNISAFTAVKDHVTWVNSVAELVKRGVKARYILIGEGTLEKEIKEKVYELGLENDIIFSGFRNDIPDILPEFDLFMFTSMNEATGGVILEAYACHVPVVAANAGGVSEVLIDEVTGLFAQVGNPISFADNVQKMFRDDDFQKKCIKNGYEFLNKNFTKEIIAVKMFEQLRLVLNTK